MRSSGTQRSPESAPDPKEAGSIGGAIVVDKPTGWTSHDVVNRMRRLTGVRRIGHLGTLDPNATGVLPVLIGRVTRLARFFTMSEKEYQGVVCFGHSTDTYDVEGKPSGEPVEVSLDPASLDRALDAFRGSFQQTPPAVSAKKVGGTPAYKLARRNQPVDLAPVPVIVHSLEVVRVAGNEAELCIRCSAGTYVRSIAHDVGQILGCGAYLKSLRRTASGGFELSGARSLDELGERAAADRLHEALIRPSDLLAEFPAEVVDSMTAGFIRQGRDFRISPFHGLGEPRYVKALSPDGDLIAIGEIRLPNLYHPVLVL